MPAPSDVHLWQIPLDAPTSTETLIDRLPRVDVRRAERIGHPKVLRRFAICQTALRAILADYLALEPADLDFTEGPWGKPALAGPASSWGLSFNLTHSHRLALLAVTRHREVGVDVEHLRVVADAQDLAERYFSVSERADLRRVAGTQAEALTFLQCWTRKEAFVKALGEGLSHPLDSFAVSCLPGEPARLLWVSGDPSVPGQWSVIGLEPLPGYVAAVATPGSCDITAFRQSPQPTTH